MLPICMEFLEGFLLQERLKIFVFGKAKWILTWFESEYHVTVMKELYFGFTWIKVAISKEERKI